MTAGLFKDMPIFSSYYVLDSMFVQNIYHYYLKIDIIQSSEMWILKCWRVQNLKTKYTRVQNKSTQTYSVIEESDCNQIKRNSNGERTKYVLYVLSNTKQYALPLS